ncbi:MAG: penicillin-binding transpeptidase domain-containing protein [Bdellovibrionia bacterium]
MVGGYSFARSEFNRAIQAPRQTGSSFKALVYAAALEKGYTAATPILDAPIVYKQGANNEEGQGDEKVWKPSNFSKDFNGDILMRNALVKSLNIPTVKIMEDIGVDWATRYSKRLGIYSPINPDFTLALGSSGVTLYEMVKAFSHFGRMGKRIKPLLIHKVEDKDGKVILENVSLDARFTKEISAQEKEFEDARTSFLAENTDLSAVKMAHFQKDPKSRKLEPAIYFEDENQIIRPETAYIMTEMLKGTVNDPNGTAVRAQSLGREIAGKTGSTNGYFDAWFIGYTPQVASGVWVGFDKERSIGVGEVGGRSALPIWMDYMKAAHDKLPQMTFPVPEGIVFASVDYDSGRLTKEGAPGSIKLPFIAGTEPKASDFRSEEATDFYKQDLEE